MAIVRKLTQTQTPTGKPGFLGAGHTARALINVPFEDSDPFILLMDDELDKQDGTPAGGPHPHAGFETVSLLLEGEMGDEAHRMQGGDLQLMTAGSGIVHTETIDTKTTMRLLQLWLALPKKDRWAQPRVQDLPLQQVPVSESEGVEIRVYSGHFAGLSSPVLNHTPLIIADIRLAPGSATRQLLPASFSAFLYVLEGSVIVGEKNAELKKGQVGWLDRYPSKEASELLLASGQPGTRLVLYAGQPTGDAIVSHGPFIGDSDDDIKRLYREFRQGAMQHISTVDALQRILW